MRRHFFLLLLLSILLFCVNNMVAPPGIMESRNLVSAREMLESGNYLIPTLNGNLRLEKPPLPTWGAAIVESLFPGSLAAQRILSAIMAWLLVWFAYLSVAEWRRNKHLALAVACILASTYSLMFNARSATWDIWAQTFCMGGIWLYARATLRQGRQLLSFAMSGVMFGLSFMSKGPVALYGLLFPFLIAFHGTVRPQMRGKWGGVGLLVLLAVIVGSWWYVYLYVFVFDKISAVVAHETNNWGHYSVRPWHYYKLFFVEAGLWSVLWLSALIDGWRFRKDKPMLMALIWSLSALILLSPMPEKKTRYLLPMMVPCALTVGFYLEQLSRNKFVHVCDRRIIQVNVAVVELVLFAASGVLLYFSLIEHRLSTVLSLATVLLLFLLMTSLSRQLMIERHQAMHLVRNYLGIMIVVSVLGLWDVAPVLINPNYKSLQSLNLGDDNRIDYFVWPSKYELRPEIMNDVRRRIYLIDCSKQENIDKCRPCVLLSPVPIDSFPAIKAMNYVPLGTFDLNWSRRGAGNYKKKLVVNAWKLE